MKPERVMHRGWIALLAAALGFAFVLGTSGFQTYWNKARRAEKRSAFRRMQTFNVGTHNYFLVRMYGEQA